MKPATLLIPIHISISFVVEEFYGTRHHSDGSFSLNDVGSGVYCPPCFPFFSLQFCQPNKCDTLSTCVLPPYSAQQQKDRHGGCCEVCRTHTPQIEHALLP